MSIAHNLDVRPGVIDVVDQCTEPELTGGRCAAEFVCAVCLELTHLGPVEGRFARGQVEVFYWLTGKPATCAGCAERFTSTLSEPL